MRLFETKAYAILVFVGNQRAKAAYPPLSEGAPSGRKKGGRYQWLHMRTCSSFVYSLLPLWDCAIQSSREENSRHYSQ